MICEIRGCGDAARAGRTYPTLCIGHALLLMLSRETLAAFVERYSVTRMLRKRGEGWHERTA